MIGVTFSDRYSFLCYFFFQAGETPVLTSVLLSSSQLQQAEHSRLCASYFANKFFSLQFSSLVEKIQCRFTFTRALSHLTSYLFIHQTKHTHWPARNQNNRSSPHSQRSLGSAFSVCFNHFTFFLFSWTVSGSLRFIFPAVIFCLIAIKRLVWIFHSVHKWAI